MSSSRRRRRRGALGLALAAVGAVGLVAAPARAQAPAPATLTSFKSLASSDGVGMVFGDPGAQPYPLGAGQQDHTETNLATGPTGYALASTAWPGPVVANAGSLAVLLGAPAQAGQVSYGGRAEAFSPAGPPDGSLPGMAAHADDQQATASSGTQDVTTGQDANQVATGDSTSTSSSSLGDGVVQASASSTISDIHFADAVTIGSVHTEAVVTTDGTTSTAGGATVVSGGSAGGSPFVVDENGVRFTDPVTGPVGEQVLANMGITMFVAAPRSTNEGSSATYYAGSLVVVWAFPGSTYVLTYEFGGSRVSVAAHPGTPAPVVPTSAPATTAPRPAPASAPVVTTPVRPAPAPPAVTATTQTATVADPAPAFAPQPAVFVVDRSLFPYVPAAGFVLVASTGLRREQDLLLRPATPASPCPLER